MVYRLCSLPKYKNTFYLITWFAREMEDIYTTQLCLFNAKLDSFISHSERLLCMAGVDRFSAHFMYFTAHMMMDVWTWTERQLMSSLTFKWIGEHDPKRITEHSQATGLRINLEFDLFLWEEYISNLIRIEKRYPNDGSLKPFRYVVLSYLTRQVASS